MFYECLAVLIVILHVRMRVLFLKWRINIILFLPNGVKCQRAKTESKCHVGMARGPARRRVRQKTRVLVSYRIEPLKCDRDALKQECRLARIACSGTQPPTHLSKKIPKSKELLPSEFRARLVQKESSGGNKNTWPPSERRQVLRRQEQNDLRH